MSDPATGRSGLFPRGRPRAVLLGAFVLFWAALQYPGWLVANRVEPFVLGLPFMFFWSLAWWAVVIAAMLYAAVSAERSGRA